MSTKVCGRCRQEKDFSEFHRRYDRGDETKASGYQGHCKPCRRDWDQEHWGVGENGIGWRERSLWINYRMRLADYDAMFEAQLGCCAICDRHQREFKRRLAVDHDHKCCPSQRSCGKCVRGLLCQNCNHGIGCLREDPALFAKALAYLRKHTTNDPMEIGDWA